MKGTTRIKVATSGSLIGKGKVPSARRRKNSNPGLLPHPDPSLSMCSTESEDQVASLHMGLDRCAALINDILQSETSDVPGPHTVVKGRTPVKGRTTVKGPGAKHLGNTSGKAVKKTATQTVRRGAGSAARGKQQQQQQPQQQQHVTPVQLHKGVKLHPSRKQTQPEPFALSPSFRAAPPPQSGQQVFDGDGDAPVRDVDPQRPLEEGEIVTTAQSLLGELRLLIAGEGSVAEILLSRLERMMLLPSTLARSGASEPGWTSLHSRNYAQLQRHEKSLQDEQVKQKERLPFTPSSTEVLTLQEELAATRLELQEARNEVAEVRRALEVAQSRLRDQEAASSLIVSELEATRSRLLNSEREKSRLASLAHQHLEDGERLNRHRNARESPCYFLKDRVEAERQTSDCVTNYLTSLGRTDIGNVPPRDGEKPSKLSASEPCGERLLGSSRRPLTSTLFGCDEEDEEGAESLLSDLSSTFNTRDEAAFKDGLSALDASIANLQKTIQLDLAK